MNAEVFGAFLEHARTPRAGLRTRRYTYVFSIAIHGALLAAGVVYALWNIEPLSSPTVPVTLLSAPSLPPPPPAAAQRSTTKAKAPRVVRPPVVTPPAEMRPAEPEPAPESDQDEDVKGEPIQEEVSGVVGGVSGGTASTTSPPLPPPMLSTAARRLAVGRYLQEIFRSRIASRFRYPPEAERLGIEGTVTVRVSIEWTGRLLALAVYGACTREILCEAALRTIREVDPFPPPPADLGPSIQVDVPLVYRLE